MLRRMFRIYIYIYFYINCIIEIHYFKVAFRHTIQIYLFQYFEKPLDKEAVLDKNRRCRYSGFCMLQLHSNTAMSR